MCSYDKWKEKRYALFNKKIDSFKNHEKYEWLRKYADDAINANEMCGLLQIKAEDFIERIESMPSDYIIDWLNRKNKLEWRECDKKALEEIKKSKR